MKGVNIILEEINSENDQLKFHKRKENKMKKLFISVPMKGRTDEAIKNSMEKMHKIAELIFGEELEVLQTHMPPEAPDGTNQSVWCLGRSIQKLAEADYFIGVRDRYGYFRGCDIEEDVAMSYNIKRFMIDMYGCDFLKDACRLETDNTH